MPPKNAQRRIALLGLALVLVAAGTVVFLQQSQPELNPPAASVSPALPAPVSDPAPLAISPAGQTVTVESTGPAAGKPAVRSAENAEPAPTLAPAPVLSANDEATLAAAYELARLQPAEAMKKLVALPPSPPRDAAIVHSISQWSAKDSKAAGAWILELPAGQLREDVLGALAVAVAERDPAGAADWVATQMSEGLAQRNAAVAVAQRWVQTDGPAAAHWVAQFPSQDLRKGALDALLRVWLTVDRPAAEKWVANQKTTDFHEEVAGVFASIRGEQTEK